MNRRSFLRSVGVAIAAVLAKANSVGAVEPAPAEEEYVKVSGTVPSPCYDCAVVNTGFCDLCDEYSEWTPILKGDGLDAVRWAGAPPPDIYVGVGDDGRALVSVNGKEPYWCNSLNDPLEQLYHDFTVAQARTIDREIMSLQGDKE